MSNQHYNSSKETGPEWATPNWLYKPLAKALNGFDIDPASGAEGDDYIADMVIRYPENQSMVGEHVVDGDTKIHYSDGLKEEWFGDVWVNPPYGRSHNPRWARKVLEESESPLVDSLTALAPASTSASWFQNKYAEADYLTFIDGRVSFDGSGDTNASFANAIATFGEVPDEYVEALHTLGLVTEVC